MLWNGTELYLTSSVLTYSLIHSNQPSRRPKRTLRLRRGKHFKEYITVGVNRLKELTRASNFFNTFSLCLRSSFVNSFESLFITLNCKSLQSRPLKWKSLRKFSAANNDLCGDKSQCFPLRGRANELFLLNNLNVTWIVNDLWSDSSGSSSLSWPDCGRCMHWDVGMYTLYTLWWTSKLRLINVSWWRTQLVTVNMKVKRLPELYERNEQHVWYKTKQTHSHWHWWSSQTVRDNSHAVDASNAGKLFKLKPQFLTTSLLLQNGTNNNY